MSWFQGDWATYCDKCVRGATCSRTGNYTANSTLTHKWWVRFAYNEPARSNTVGSCGCFSTQRWQHLTYHLLQCTASVWSTASTSWPTIATHVSAKPNRTAWKRVTYMGGVYWLHCLSAVFCSTCSMLQVLEHVWIACACTVPVRPSACC